FGHTQSIGASVNINKVFFNGIWQAKWSVSGSYEIIDGTINNEDIGSRSWDYSGIWENRIRLSKKRQVSLELSYYYGSPFIYVTRIGEDTHLLSVNLKKMFKFGGTLELSAQNLLNKRDRRQYDTGNYGYKINTLTDKRRYVITYSQTFGKSKVRGASDRTSSRLSNRTNK
ncbi:MAG: outer membrane beta-barrel protein, partial [Rikenellaceae bacterium]